MKKLIKISLFHYFPRQFPPFPPFGEGKKSIYLKTIIMYTITIFKGLPFKQECINPVTGTKYYKIMEYPPFYEDITMAFDIIRQEKFKSQIDLMRTFHDTDKPKYDELKHKLPICLFTGRYSNFSISGLIESSNLVVIDFDKIPLNDMSSQWSIITKDPYTFAAFVSPSGKGYKVVVKVENNPDNTTHSEYLNALKAYYNSPYWDNNCFGISRACFLSSDPSIYVNWDSWTWTKKIPSSQATVPSYVPVKIYAPTSEYEKLINFLDGGFDKFPMTPGNRHDSSFRRARELAEWGIPRDTAFRYLSQFIAPDFGENELLRQIRNAYGWVEKRGTFGSKYRKI